jgi:hypothetical protein
MEEMFESCSWQPNEEIEHGRLSHACEENIEIYL